MGKEKKYFSRRAEQIKNNINKYLYNDQDKIYYNLDSKSGEHIKRVSASCFSPLFADIASSDQAKLIITKYLLSPSFMWSRFGVRTLAANDSEYNNKNIVKPFSNWQGPIWLVFNYICMQGLLRYGFQKRFQKYCPLFQPKIFCRRKLLKNIICHRSKPRSAGRIIPKPKSIQTPRKKDSPLKGFF